MRSKQRQPSSSNQSSFLKIKSLKYHCHDDGYAGDDEGHESDSDNSVICGISRGLMKIEAPILGIESCNLLSDEG